MARSGFVFKQLLFTLLPQLDNSGLVLFVDQKPNLIRQNSAHRPVESLHQFYIANSVLVANARDSFVNNCKQIAWLKLWRDVQTIILVVRHKVAFGGETQGILFSLLIQEKLSHLLRPIFCLFDWNFIRSYSAIHIDPHHPRSDWNNVFFEVDFFVIELVANWLGLWI